MSNRSDLNQAQNTQISPSAEAALDLSSVTFRPDKATSISPAVKPIESLPTLGAERDQVLKQAAHHHHQHTTAEAISERHQALRAAGREGPLPQAQVLSSSRPTSSAAVNTSHNDVAQQQDSVSLLTLAKKKGATGDREVDEFIERHPEMAQWAQKLKETRDAVLKNASQDAQGAFDSKSNLQAKLETIANHLEGSPLAPALRMGDMTARKAFIEVVRLENPDTPELAKAAEIVWDKARENLKATEAKSTQNQALTIHAQELQKEAERHGRARAEALAAEKPISAERLQYLDAESARIQAAAKNLAPQNPALAEFIAQTERRAEEKRRTELVGERVWQLQLQVEIQRGRAGDEAATQKLQNYLTAQRDLLERSPGIKVAISEHQQAAQKEGFNLRLRCDSAAQLFYNSVDGLGSTKEDTRKALQNRSQLELQIISERYQEMYREDILEAIDGDYDGDAYDEMSGYLKGDLSNRGELSRALNSQVLETLFAAQDQNAALQTILFADRATQASVLVENALKSSDNLAAEILRIGKEFGVGAADIQKAAQERGQPDLMEAVRARLENDRRQSPNPLSQQRIDAELKVLGEYFRTGTVTKDSLAEYAEKITSEHFLSLGLAETSETQNPALIEDLKTKYQRASQVFQPLLEANPVIAAQVDSAKIQKHFDGQIIGMEQTYQRYGQELGLTYGRGAEGEAERKGLEDKLARYRQSLESVVPPREDIEQYLQGKLTAGIERGKAERQEAEQIAAKMYEAIDGLGTTEETVYSSLQDKSGRVMALANEIFLKERDYTFAQAIEGDMEGVERDKALACLNRDSIGVRTSDVQIALSGFFGVDQNLLRSTLRSLETDSERAALSARFVERGYNKTHFSGDSVGAAVTTATSLNQALEFKLKGDALIASQALLEGNFARADAAEVHEARDGTFGYNDDDAAIHLNSFKNADGFQDTERIAAAVAAFNTEYKIDLRSIDSERSGTEAAWLGALARGEELKSAQLQLAYAIDEEDKALVMDVFAVPAELRAQIWREESRGGVSPETQAKLDARIQFGGNVLAMHEGKKSEQDPSVWAEIADSFNDRDSKILRTVIQNGRLSRADVISEACEGLGTTVSDIYSATSDLTKSQVQDLIKEFRDKEYGDLVTVLDGDLSGDEYFDIVQINLAGTPETLAEVYELASKRYQHETSGLLSVCVWGDQDEKMARDLALLEKMISSSPEALSHEGDAIYRRFGISADAYRSQKNFVADVVSNTGVAVVMVAGSVTVVVASGGTAAPAVGAILMWSTVGAGALRVGTNYLIKGDAYGDEAFAFDVGLSAIDLASMKVATLIPAGRLVEKGVEQALGRVVAAGGRQVIGAEGQLLTGEALYQALTQSSRVARMAVGAAQGSVDAAIMAPVQVTLATAINEQTWHDGILAGFERMGTNALYSIGPAMAIGVVAGSSFRFRTPLEVKLGKPLSMETAQKLRANNTYGDEGTAHLAQREQSRGFITKGDVQEAKLINQKLSPAESEKLLAQMRSNPQRYSDGDIQVFENRLQNGGSLNKFDKAVVDGSASRQGFSTISESNLEKRIVKARQELAQRQSEARGFESAEVKYAQGRLDALEQVHTAIQSRKTPALEAPNAETVNTRQQPTAAAQEKTAGGVSQRVEPSISKPKSPEEIGLENGIKRYDDIIESGKFSNGEAIDPADISMFRQEKAALEAQLAVMQKAPSSRVKVPELDPEIEAALRKAAAEAEDSFHTRSTKQTDAVDKVLSPEAGSAPEGISGPEGAPPAGSSSLPDQATHATKARGGASGDTAKLEGRPKGEKLSEAEESFIDVKETDAAGRQQIVRVKVKTQSKESQNSSKEGPNETPLLDDVIKATEARIAAEQENRSLLDRAIEETMLRQSSSGKSVAKPSAVEPSIPKPKTPEAIALENGIKRYDDLISSGNFSNGEVIDADSIGIFRQEKAVLEAQLAAMQKASPSKVKVPELAPDLEASLREAIAEAEANLRSRNPRRSGPVDADEPWSPELEARRYGSSPADSPDDFGPLPGDPDWDPFGGGDGGGFSHGGSSRPSSPSGSRAPSGGGGSSPAPQVESPRPARGSMVMDAPKPRGPQSQLQQSQGRAAGPAVMEPEIQIKPIVEVELPSPALRPNAAPKVNPQVTEVPQTRPVNVPNTFTEEIAGVPSLNTSVRAMEQVAARNMAKVMPDPQDETQPLMKPQPEPERLRQPKPFEDPIKPPAKTGRPGGEGQPLGAKPLNSPRTPQSEELAAIKKMNERDEKQMRRGGHSKRHVEKISDGLGETEIEIERGDD